MSPAPPVAEPAADRLVIEFAESPSAIAAALTQWRALAANASAIPCTASSNWTEAWLRHYGDCVQPRVAIGRRGGKAIAFWLVPRSRHRCHGPVPLRTAHLGTAGEPERESVFVEHNRPFVADGLGEVDEAAFVEAVWNRLGDDPVDRIDADGLPAEIADPLLAALATDDRSTLEVERRASRWMRFTREEHGCDLMAMLRRKTRSNYRRAAKRYSAVETTWQTGPEASANFDILIRLHQVRWERVGEPGSFSGTRLRAFLGDLLNQRKAAVAVTTDQGEPFGAAYLVSDAGRAVCLVVGFGDTARFESPGLVSLVPIMGEACSRGFDGFEFLAGDSLYKRMLTNESCELVWIKQSQPTYRSRLTAHLVRWKRRLRPAT